jgi:hypothetical protein
MPPRPLALITLAAVLIVLPTTQRAAHAGVKVVVLEDQPVPLPVLGPQAVRNALEAVVKSLDAEVVAAADATHILRVQGAYENDVFRFSLDLRDRASARIASVQDKCELCTSDEMLRLLRERAVLLCSQYLSHAGRRADSTPPDVTSREVSPAPADAPTGARSRWPLALGAVGFALVATGAVFVALGKRPTCTGDVPASECPEVRSFRPAGFLLGGIGLAAAAGALVWYHGETARPGRARLSIGPTGAMLSGSF